MISSLVNRLQEEAAADTEKAANGAEGLGLGEGLETSQFVALWWRAAGAWEGS